LNLITRGFGALSKILTRGFGSTITIIVTPIIKPSGGGGLIELPPEPHPFRLIETKRIKVEKKQNISVKVIKEELKVEAEYKFDKYNKIKIIFKGIDV